MLNGIDDIEGLTDDQKALINKATDGLSEKNKELLGKVSASSEANVSTLAEMEALRKFKSNSDKQTAEDAENWKEVERLSNEAHSKEIESLTAKGDDNESLIKTLLIDNGLSDALDGININPALKSGAIAMLHGKCAISEGQAMIGEKSLSEAVKEWSETDIGKAYTLATNNSGMGLNGGKPVEKGGKWADYTPVELSAIHKDDPDQYEQLKTTR